MPLSPLLMTVTLAWESQRCPFDICDSNCLWKHGETSCYFKLLKVFSLVGFLKKKWKENTITMGRSALSLNQSGESSSNFPKSVASTFIRSKHLIIWSQILEVNYMSVCSNDWTLTFMCRQLQQKELSKCIVELALSFLTLVVLTWLVLSSRHITINFLDLSKTHNENVLILIYVTIPPPHLLLKNLKKGQASERSYVWIVWVSLMTSYVLNCHCLSQIL